MGKIPSKLYRKSKIYFTLTANLSGFFLDKVISEIQINDNEKFKIILPINFICFCSMIEINESEFNKSILPLKESKKQLRITSLNGKRFKLNDVLNSILIDKCISAAISKSQTKIFAATSLKYGSKSEIKLFLTIELIDLSNELKIEVYSSNNKFQEVILNNLSEMIQ